MDGCLGGRKGQRRMSVLKSIVNGSRGMKVGR